MKNEIFVHQMVFQSQLHYEICGYDLENCPCPEDCDLCAEASKRSAELHAKAGC